MKIKSKFIIIIFLLFIFSFSHVYAVNTIFNSLNNNNENLMPETENLITDISTNYAGDADSTTLNPAPVVTHTSSSDNGLSVSDIISIILISVCIVLIFLAIAILIRCK